METKKHWDEVFSKNDVTIKYDDWLLKYLEKISPKDKILDLGCGLGNDTLYLIEKGYSVLSCDFSKVALNYVKNNIKNSQIKYLDISKPLPFLDNSFNVVVADLSLHYFNDETTKSIMHEIKRILDKNGYLLARVNSVKDKNHGAQDGEEVEKNFRLINGEYKRFFDSESVEKYFKIIGKPVFFETEMTRYKTPKTLFEIICKNEVE